MGLMVFAASVAAASVSWPGDVSFDSLLRSFTSTTSQFLWDAYLIGGPIASLSGYLLAVWTWRGNRITVVGTLASTLVASAISGIGFVVLLGPLRMVVQLGAIYLMLALGASLIIGFLLRWLTREPAAEVQTAERRRDSDGLELAAAVFAFAVVVTIGVAATVLWVIAQLQPALAALANGPSLQARLAQSFWLWGLQWGAAGAIAAEMLRRGVGWSLDAYALTLAAVSTGVGFVALMAAAMQGKIVYLANSLVLLAQGFPVKTLIGGLAVAAAIRLTGWRRAGGW